MHRLLPALLLLGHCAASAQLPRTGGPSPFHALLGTEEEPEDGENRVIPAISLLPDGSILEKVMFPRYDENRKLTSVLHADEMTLLGQNRISGKIVTIETFNPDSTVRARIDLASTLFDQNKGLLSSDDRVTLASDRLVTEGTALIFSLEERRGFLSGPSTTTLLPPPPTAMNSSSPGLRATALLGFSILPLIAAPPAVTAEESAALQQETQPLAPELRQAAKDASNDLRSILNASDAVNRTTAEFLEKADLLAANGTAQDSPAPEPKPLDFKPDPQSTTITCDGGVYFDATQQVAVFLKNVVVTDPAYRLTAANELKIFFEKKTEPAQDRKTPATPPKIDKKDGTNTVSLGAGGFGDPRAISATGNVVVEQRNVPAGETATKASGQIFHYDLNSGTLTVSGGYPWFIEGNRVGRAKSANAWVRIDKNNNIVADPNSQWEFNLRRSDSSR